MSKPKIYGMKSTFIPNSKADMRFRKKIYQRGREITEREPAERRKEKTNENLHSR